jgi:hypothetical protein
MMGFGCICFENLLFRFAIIVVGGGSVFSKFLRAPLGTENPTGFPVDFLGGLSTRLPFPD